MKPKFIVLIILATACLGVSCSTPQLSEKDCGKITDARPQSLPWVESSIPVFKDWIKSHYILQDSAIKETVYYDKSQGLEWNSESRDYSLELHQLKRLHVSWQTKPLRIADIIKCLGKPSLYQAETGSDSGGPVHQLFLWYPEQGLVVGAGMRGGSPNFSETSQMEYMIFVKPAPMSDMLMAVFQGGGWKVLMRETSVKPWPGKVDSLEFHREYGLP